MTSFKEMRGRLARLAEPAIQDDHWLMVVFIALLLVTAILVTRA